MLHVAPRGKDACFMWIEFVILGLIVHLEAIHLQNPYFKVSTRTQRRVIECRASVTFAKADVFINPNRLSVARKRKMIQSKKTKTNS